MIYKAACLPSRRSCPKSLWLDTVGFTNSKYDYPASAKSDYTTGSLVVVAHSCHAPASYSDWLALGAMRRRERKGSGCTVLDMPVPVLFFASYCERTGIKRPSVLTLDRCGAGLVRRLRRRRLVVRIAFRRIMKIERNACAVAFLEAAAAYCASLGITTESHWRTARRGQRRQAGMRRKRSIRSDRAKPCGALRGASIEP